MFLRVSVFISEMSVSRSNLPVMDTLMAKAMTRSGTVGVTVMKCQEFSSGYKSIEHAVADVPS